jgi:uncharacterized protein YajQ (UPF0234 family)
MSAGRFCFRACAPNAPAATEIKALKAPSPMNKFDIAVLLFFHTRLIHCNDTWRIFMPSFDVVSEVDHHELTNAVDQMNREISNRYDFKGSAARVELKEQLLNIEAENEFQIKQMHDIIYKKLAARSVDTACLEQGKIEERGMRAYQTLTIREGVDKELAKKIVKMIKETKMKVQAAIQGDQVRVTGKKRDDLQAVIEMLKGADIDLPLQFTNFRD